MFWGSVEGAEVQRGSVVGAEAEPHDLLCCPLRLFSSNQRSSGRRWRQDWGTVKLRSNQRVPVQLMTTILLIFGRCLLCDAVTNYMLQLQIMHCSYRRLNVQ